MQIKVVGNSSGYISEVDSNNNQKIITSTTESLSPFVSTSTKIDQGTYTETVENRALEVSENFRLRTGQPLLLFEEKFATTQASSRNNWVNDGANTIGANHGYILMNSAFATTTNTASSNRTLRHFPIYKQITTCAAFNVSISDLLLVGLVYEFGLFNFSNNAEATNGVLFRITQRGSFHCVAVNDGVENRSEDLNLGDYTVAGKNTQYKIYVDSDKATFFINETRVATLTVSRQKPQLLSVQSAPLAVRARNAADGIVQANSVMMADCAVYLLDLGGIKPISDIQAGMSRAALQIPEGNGGQTSNYTNSLAAGAGAAIANASAAAGFQGLGGQYAVTPTLTVGTDGIIMSYQVASAAVSRRNVTLFVTGIRIQGVVTTALSGNTNGVIYEYAVGLGSSSQNLTTTDGAATRAPRRMPLGISKYDNGATVGTISDTVYVRFDTPLACVTGQYFQILAKNLGTATVSGVITHLITIDGYFDS